MTNNRHVFPCGKKNPAKREDVRKKISDSKIGELNPNWKPKIKKICIICHNDFFIVPHDKKRETCSKKCSYEKLSMRMKKNNPMFVFKYKEKSHNKNKENIKNGLYVPFMCTSKGKKIISEKASERALSANNPLRALKGKTWEEFYGEKIAELKKKESSIYLKENNPTKNPAVRKKISDFARERAKTIIGKLHPCYIDGRSNIPYPYEFRKIRKYILERDNYTCQKCKTKDKLSVHHIDYNKNNNNKNNLITLCIICNIKMNKKEIRDAVCENK